MATKMSAGLKFEIEVLKRLYMNKPVKMVYVKGSRFNIPWSFNSVWYGFDNGEFLRPMISNYIATPETCDWISSDFEESNLEIASGYDFSSDSIDNTIISEPVEIKDGRKKRKVVKLTSPTISVSIDSRYFEYFEDGFRFVLKDEFSPVLIIHSNLPSIQGLIYPFIMKR